MLEALFSAARRLFRTFSRDGDRIAVPSSPPAAAESLVCYRPLEKVILTDSVCRTLFDEYLEHRLSARGDEETGWLLMGRRYDAEALVMATLPAGAQRRAGIAHVQFNSNAQAVASRIVRQHDTRIKQLGVVHTHPGNLRHPSQGDLDGDRQWVKLLHGGEGVFAIGTADAPDDGSPLTACQPKGYVQCYQGLRFSWYGLGTGDSNYRPLPIQLTIGPDLALPLHQVWPLIELHADELDQLYRRLGRVRVEIVTERNDAELHVVVPLEPTECVRAIIREDGVKYCYVRKDDWMMSDSTEPRVDRGVYLLLATLAEK